MGEDEKMFQIGVWTCVAVLLLTVCLQVCYRTQNNALRDMRIQTAETQKQIASEQRVFESLTRPEMLRGVVFGINPRAEIIGSKKYVSINDIPLRKN